MQSQSIVIGRPENQNSSRGSRTTNKIGSNKIWVPVEGQEVDDIWSLLAGGHCLRLA
jgi:hypothetical protein